MERADELSAAASIYALVAESPFEHRQAPAVMTTPPPASVPIPRPETPVEASTHSAKDRHETHIPSVHKPADSAPKKASKPQAEAPPAVSQPPAVMPPRRRRPAEAAGKAPIPGQRNILVTSALPYVNNVPHLGNIIGSTLSADVYARYCRQRGINTIYMCGTDEYGTATETKAAEEKLTPRQICDKFFIQHAAIYDWFDIAFDYFGRTSCEDPWHSDDWPQTRIAQDIFLDNLAQGNLVEQVVEQVFCLGCSKFLADRFIEGTCPLCGYDDARGDQCDKCGKLLNATELKSPRCKAVSTHAVEVRNSKHMFLDLPKLEPQLRAWILKSSTEGAWTANSIAVTDGWLASGLKPRCITRDLKWGTPVPHPDFKDKVFYVWFDAPIGYISITANYSPEHWREWWQNPKDVSLYQFMGKDNIPFHTVIFPASLLGSGKDWTLLHHVSTTEYLNYESGKFSKSRGVGVFGDNAIETGIPSEVWRYFLLSNRPEVSDSVFTWDDFAMKNNNELLKNVGNLVQRSLSFIFASFGGVVPSQAGAATERDAAFVRSVNALVKDFNEAMGAVKLKLGLKVMMDMAAEANKYMQDTKPWDLKNTAPEQCSTVMNLMAHFVRLLANTAEPFMPGFTDKVLHILDLPHGRIPDAFCEETAIGSAAAAPLQQLVPSEAIRIPAGHRISKPVPLFSVIGEAQIEAFRARFAGKQQVENGAANGVSAPTSAVPVASAAAGKKPKGAPSSSSSGAPPPQSDMARIDLRVGRIVRAWPHPEADKLWCEEIDIGEEKPRRVASGLRAYYSQEGMTGRRIIVVANLKPRTMVGFESQGMVLCASNEDRSVVEFIDPPQDAKVGERITIDGFSSSAADGPGEIVNPAKKGNAWTAIASDLRTDGARVATYKGVPLSTSAGACVAPTQANAPIS